MESNYAFEYTFYYNMIYNKKNDKWCNAIQPNTSRVDFGQMIPRSKPVRNRTTFRRRAVQHFTHWGRETQLTIIGSDNGLSPGRHQAILWTNAGILNPYEQNSVKSLSKFINFHSRKCIWKCRLRNGGHFVSASLCFTWCSTFKTFKNVSAQSVLRCHLWCWNVDQTLWAKFFKGVYL